MSNFTFDYDVFSDLYKEVNGIRPRGHEFYAPETTDERRQEIWDFYISANEREMAESRAREAAAIERFEATLASYCEMGAVNREVAIRWLVDAYGEEAEHYGYEVVEHHWGLPYGYLTKEAA